MLLCLNLFIALKYKNSNFCGLKWHLSIPPVQDIPLAAKISKYTLRAFVLKFLQYLALSFTFFFKGKKLQDKVKSEALDDESNLYYLTIFHAFSSF
jgi:hypothetical protein